MKLNQEMVTDASIDFRWTRCGIYLWLYAYAFYVKTMISIYCATSKNEKPRREERPGLVDGGGKVRV
jgi:hypothetical protein